MNKIIIFGTAEIASLAKFYFTHDSEFDVVGFTVDDDYIDEDRFESLPVIPFSELNKSYPSHQYQMHVALSYNKLNQIRSKKYNQAKEAGYQLASYISSKSTTWQDLKIGDNCFILEDQTIQPTVTIGSNVMLWSGNHIGHGTHIGDHTYFASQVVVSGHCTIGKRCFLGVNATLKDFLTIGDDVFIAMGASVTKDLESGATVLAPPSTILRPEDRRAKSIRKSYFNL